MATSALSGSPDGHPSPLSAQPAVDFLREDRFRLERSSTAARVADVLRTRVLEGRLEPGTRLPEKQIGAALGVSRNTLREAFQLLARERLLAHELNRGVFVRVLGESDVRDIYRMRTIVECGAISQTEFQDQLVSAVEAEVIAGEQAAAAQDWAAVGTADLRFHLAVVALAGSPRAYAVMESLLAELRLAFVLMPDPRRFHEPYLRRNREILSHLATNDRAVAEQMMRDYLWDAEQQIHGAYAASSLQAAD